MKAGRGLTRKQFLLSMGAAAAPAATPGEEDAGRPRILLVVAHPDDEYTFAATVYRVAKELHGTVDQVIVTNGEAGYRYSQLAEQFYQANLTDEKTGRARLPEIRRREALAAGRILGIRNHHFLAQKDTRYTLDAGEPLAAWDTAGVTRWLTELLAGERYDFVFTLLPTRDTHGHHKAATLLALDAVGRLPEELRPVVLGGDPAVAAGAPVFRFKRTSRFGFHETLSYQIVVNWMIAEHKSQGLFQTDCNKHDEERFWVFALGDRVVARTERLFEAVRRTD